LAVIMIGYKGTVYAFLVFWTSLNVDNGFKVAVRILEVDKIIMVSWSGRSFSSFQWLEDLPEVLVVAER